MTTKKKTPYLQILTQPPIEQRTRTAKEKRLFKTSVRIHLPNWHQLKMLEQLQVNVSLLYADSTTVNRVPEATSSSSVNGLLLGGTTSKTVFVNTTQLKGKSDRRSAHVDVTFDDLNLNEPSSRHKDREFCILFTLKDKDGVVVLDEEETTACYAYSHPKVLKRRRDISLKALSTVVIDHHTNKESRMHAVGGPFIQSPRLGVMFQFISHSKEGEVIEQVKLYARNLELFSESVLFFDAPRYPEQINGRAVTICVSITNDSRHFSNSESITYVRHNIGIVPVFNNQINMAEIFEEKRGLKQLLDSDVDNFLDANIFSNNDVDGRNALYVHQPQRRRTCEDWTYTINNGEDNEEGAELTDEKMEFENDGFSLPLSLNGHGHDKTNINNFNTSSPSSWEDNEGSAPLSSEELNIPFAFDDSFESTSDIAFLKPKRKRMRSRM